MYEYVERQLVVAIFQSIPSYHLGRLRLQQHPDLQQMDGCRTETSSTLSRPCESQFLDVNLSEISLPWRYCAAFSLSSETFPEAG